MLDLARNGYTRQEVIDQLHGKKGSRGLVKIRYDLLNRQDVKLGELAVQSGRVSMNSLAEIKRTALFELTEQEAQDVDWLNDRIRPVFCLKMPEIRKTGKAWGKIDASFSRSSIAYLSDGTRVAANVPRFEQGKFGKAVMVEEGTENLVINGSIENNLSYWYATNDTSAGDNGVVRRIVGDAAVGNACLEYEITNRPSWGFFYNDYNQYRTSPYFDTSKQYTISFWAKRISGSNTMLVKISDLNSQNVVWSGGSFTLYDTWTRYTFTFTPAIAGNQPVVFFTYYIAGQTGKCRIDGLQIEQQRYATSFTDSTRAAEMLTIPTAGVLNPQEGTVEFWVKPLVVANWNNFFNMVTSNGRFLLFFRADGIATFDYGVPNSGITTPGGTIVANNWYHIVLRWSESAGKQALFINGNKYEQDLPNGVASSFPATVGIVDNYSAYIDDLRISSRARSDAEILAAYQSGRPAPVDEWTMLKLDFSYFEFWNEFQSIYFLLSHIEYKPDLFVEEYVIKLEVIGLAISGSTITLKATFPDSAGDLQELENVVVKIYAPGKVLLKTIPATKISTGVYTADYTIPEDKEGQFDYEFSGSLESRTIVGRSSFDSHWR